MSALITTDLVVLDDDLGNDKGAVVRYLSRAYDVPPSRIATLGDQPNDVLMFAHSGLSIAMGNSDREVQRSARRVTAS